MGVTRRITLLVVFFVVALQENIERQAQAARAPPASKPPTKRRSKFFTKKDKDGQGKSAGGLAVPGLGSSQTDLAITSQLNTQGHKVDRHRTMRFSSMFKRKASRQEPTPLPTEGLASVSASALANQTTSSNSEVAFAVPHAMKRQPTIEAAEPKPAPPEEVEEEAEAEGEGEESFAEDSQVEDLSAPVLLPDASVDIRRLTDRVSTNITEILKMRNEAHNGADLLLRFNNRQDPARTVVGGN
eukprot:c19364_g1_i4.p1 GENE.c19364_g1_i4~~c19364_g1_i4.p1  ORF type:complete len:243 (+),score=62.69 c19364_g1_i4:699-1427(+)